MSAKIAWPWELPDVLGGVAVVADVWGATTNINSFFRKGVKKLFIVNANNVKRAKNFYKDALIIGESLELPKNFFDSSNYPSDIEKVNVRGKTVLYMSNNGSRIIEFVIRKGTKKVITVSFTNISAVANYLKREKENIYLIPSGDIESVNQKVLEDLICVESLDKLTRGVHVDLEKAQKEAENFIKINYAKENFDQVSNFKIVFNLNSSKAIPVCNQEKQGWIKVVDKASLWYS